MQGSPVTAERVLVVHKTSRLDFEKMKQPNLSEEIADEVTYIGLCTGCLGTKLQ